MRRIGAAQGDRRATLQRLCARHGYHGRIIDWIDRDLRRCQRHIRTASSPVVTAIVNGNGQRVIIDQGGAVGTVKISVCNIGQLVKLGVDLIHGARKSQA